MPSAAKLQSLLRSGGHTELLLLVTSGDFVSWAKESSFIIGTSPLHLAVATGDIDVVKQIVALGFNLNAVENKPCDGQHYASHYNFTALHEAVRQRDLPMVKALLDLGVVVSFRCKTNGVYAGTAECYARAKGYPEIANAIGKSGSTRSATVIRNYCSTAGFKVGTISAVVNDHMQYKSSISMKLRKAQEARGKLEALSKEGKESNKQLGDAKAEKAKLTASLQLAERNIRICERKLDEIKEKEEMLKKDCLSPTEKKRLENTMKALSKEEAGFRCDPIEVDVLDCVVCMSPPSAKAYTCQACDTLMCPDCLNKLDKCPTCRVVFKKKPARRSRIAERMLEKLNERNKK